MINQARGNTFTLTLATPIVKDPSSSMNYNDITNKPKINGVELEGDLSLEAIGAQPAGDYPSQSMSSSDVDELINSLD